MAGDPTEFEIRPFEEHDRDAVRALWHQAGLVVPGNDPDVDIDRKLAHSPDQLLVGLRGLSVVATVMVGYDGHRGWINYLAVNPSEQGTGVGAAMMLHAQELLRELGCPKINLQVRATNEGVIAFYEAIGYQTDAVVSMSLRLVDDSHPSIGSAATASPSAGG